ncbi:peptidoglycan-binding protein [Streptomyces sp. NPDC051105]|uniref:peptidoglycan-binding protein n=1 Tax=Streptomyces sp. NPDC051105 TaxID=3154843 RepID=UPI003417C645
MSTPPDPEQPRRGPILEPVRVLRPRRLDALAELMREIREEAEADEKARETGKQAGSQTGDPTGKQAGSRTGDPTGKQPGPADFEAFDGHGRPGAGTEDETQELPPVADGPPGHGHGHDDRSSRAFGFGPGLRRAAAVVAVGAAALVGFGCALLLPGREGTAAAAQPAPSATTSPVTTSPASDTSTDPDGAGTLREGDTGPEVVDLEQRLLRIPDVYRDGSTGGTYDTALTAAVERFQIWYGISGDERGVYGDDTRRALESRTSPTAG